MYLYSQKWYETFSLPYFQSEIEREVNFLTYFLPIKTHSNILDIACGTGRISKPLSEMGYNVLGIDVSISALNMAREQDPLTNYLVKDMRTIDTLNGQFDGILLLWFSFGFFNHLENMKLISMIAQKLRNRGRLILDIHNKLLYEEGKYPSERILNWNNRNVIEKSKYENNQLSIHLKYTNGQVDQFSWMLYSIDELLEICNQANLNKIDIFHNFDKTQKVGDVTKRHQLVFEKSSPGLE